jgi:hypothetical protein
MRPKMPKEATIEHMSGAKAAFRKRWIADLARELNRVVSLVSILFMGILGRTDRSH